MLGMLGMLATAFFQHVVHKVTHDTALLFVVIKQDDATVAVSYVIWTAAKRKVQQLTTQK
jgi:hypothetical protein